MRSSEYDDSGRTKEVVDLTLLNALGCFSWNFFSSCMWISLLDSIISKNILYRKQKKEYEIGVIHGLYGLYSENLKRVVTQHNNRICFKFLFSYHSTT